MCINSGYPHENEDVMDSDLFGEEPSIPKNGGRREGAGRKKGVKNDQETYNDYSAARAKKERYLADNAELEFKRKSGELVPRDAVRQASATSFSVIAQSLRSISDNIERRLGIAPEVVVEIEKAIDEALDELANDLERMVEKDYA